MFRMSPTAHPPIAANANIIATIVEILSCTPWHKVPSLLYSQFMEKYRSQRAAEQETDVRLRQMTSRFTRPEQQGFLRGFIAGIERYQYFSQPSSESEQVVTVSMDDVAADLEAAMETDTFWLRFETERNEGSSSSWLQEQIPQTLSESMQLRAQVREARLLEKV